MVPEGVKGLHVVLLLSLFRLFPERLGQLNSGLKCLVCSRYPLTGLGQDVVGSF
jgi:hypothetical protein